LQPSSSTLKNADFLSDENMLQTDTNLKKSKTVTIKSIDGDDQSHVNENYKPDAETSTCSSGTCVTSNSSQESDEGFSFHARIKFTIYQNSNQDLTLSGNVDQGYAGAFNNSSGCIQTSIDLNDSANDTVEEPASNSNNNNLGQQTHASRVDKNIVFKKKHFKSCQVRNIILNDNDDEASKSAHCWRDEKQEEIIVSLTTSTQTICSETTQFDVNPRPITTARR
jgi:hypothetical protein